MSKFQVIFTAIFVLFIIVGVAVFATFKSGGRETLPSITIWGTIPSNTFTTFLSELNINRAEPLNISYEEIDEATFNEQFVETLARGGGPDAILVPHELVLKEEDKLVPIPYSVFPERDFKNTFIQSAELYLTPRGVLALPLSIDPLVMYWNRDLMTNAGLATHPQYWSEFQSLAGKINRKDSASNITRSALALGEFRNVLHAKEILSALIMQTGNPIVTRGAEGPQVTFEDGAAGASAAVEFFTQFSNPVLTTYSWNRALPSSKNFFIAGDLATYFGFSSEIADIRAKNPNLNFDVASLPQAKDAPNRVTYGKIHALAIAKSSVNPNGTFMVLNELTSPQALSLWGEQTGLPPVRRDLISQTPTDPYLAVFYDAALTSRAWIDPDPVATGRIFQTMVENVISSRETLVDAVDRAGEELEALYE